jgi:hypothetical protein
MDANKVRKPNCVNAESKAETDPLWLRRDHDNRLDPAAVAADRKVASLLGEVDPGAFEEADAFAKAEALCYSLFFLRSISASISPRYPHASS